MLRVISFIFILILVFIIYNKKIERFNQYEDDKLFAVIICTYRRKDGSSLDNLKKFRQIGSILPGHPEHHLTPGIEVSTGPLGQGIANGVGIALGLKHLASIYNTDNIQLIDNTVYVLCGDGCLMEGISYEAISLAGHLWLDNLVLIYDDNGITIDGNISLAFSERIQKRYESSGWYVQTIKDGNNWENIQKPLLNAKNYEGKPSLIILKTTIGYGSYKEGTSKVHGSPLGKDDIIQFKEISGLDINKDLTATYLLLAEAQRQKGDYLDSVGSFVKFGRLKSVENKLKDGKIYL